MTPNQVQDLRHRHGLSRTMLSKMCWCSRFTVRRWEHGAVIDPARFELAAMKLGDTEAQQQVREWAEREVNHE